MKLSEDADRSSEEMSPPCRRFSVMSTFYGQQHVFVLPDSVPGSQNKSSMNSRNRFLQLKNLLSWFRFVALAIVTMLALGGCGASDQLGPRPATELSTVVEAYLQLYQPGPLPRLFQTTYIYDRNGELLAELYNEGRRTWVGLEDISPYLIDATVATEDASFFTNPGIDPVRIVGAAWKNAEQGEIVSGASTITMQLARNLFLGPDDRYNQSVDRKILEAGLARELTAAYSKEELLEMYLNLLNYGHLAYGPEAAAQVYFGKSASELTLAEASLLAGIPQQPANLDLFRNYEGAKNRQRTVLDLMVRHGFLTQAEADAAFQEPITLNPNPDQRIVRAPHFVNYVLAELDARLGEGYVRRSGFRIRTSLDLKFQELAEQVVAEKVAELQPRYDMNNAALVALKPGTAEILAMVGSVDFYNTAIQGQVNVATSLRQPGSSIKPVLYSTAMDDLLISPASVLWDVPVTYTVGIGQTYRPVNYSRNFHGPVTVRTALANSYNVPAVKLLDRLGVARMLEKARAMGIHSLNRGSDWYGLSLTLGGGEVTLLDLSTAYHTIANGGQYVPPLSVLSITDSEGRPMMEDPAPAATPVLSPATAFLVTDILSDNQARIPAFGPNNFLQLSRPAAAKTGTTDDYRDNWTVGFTRYLLTGVWAGNTDGRPMQRSSGSTGAAPIWNAFMEAVLANPDLLARLGASSDEASWQFAPPPDVERRPDCPPGLVCRNGGEYFSQAWLEAMGDQGPLADSVVTVKSAPVYADSGEGGRLVGFCEYEQGAERTLLRLPGQFTPPTGEQQASSSDLATANQPIVNGPSSNQEGTAEENPAVRLEQNHAIAWTLRHPAQVNLGPCDQLANLVPAALALDPAENDGNLRVLVDLQAAGQVEISEIASSSATALNSPIITGDFSYGLDRPVYHDTECPGSYVVGLVLNAAGAPVGGVRILMEDPWNNRYESVSKSGAYDAGRFDFPLYSSTPQELRVTVLDSAGNPASPTVIVPHNMDAASQTLCHHVVFRGR
jgi:penicillin-binding protein 1C